MATGRYKNYYTVTYPDDVVLDGRSYALAIKRDAVSSYAEKFAVEVAIYGRRLAYSDNVTYPANAAQATYTFSIPPDAAQYMTSATQSMKFTVSRMSGSTPDGWEDYRGATATVPQSSAPTFSLSHNEAGTGVPSGWGYTRNLSKLAAYITGAAGKYGASVSSFKLSFAGFSSTSSSMTTGVLSASGTFALTATVTDTRGMSTVKTVNVSVMDYQFPTIVSASASRCNASGVADEEGTSAKVQCDYTNSTAGGLNAVTTTLRYRVSGASAWTTVAGGFADNVAKVVAGTFGTDSQYEFLFTVADKAKTVSRSATLDMAFFTMDFLTGGKGIAFGAPATRTGFDCHMPAYLRALTLLDGAQAMRAGRSASWVSGRDDAMVRQTSVSGYSPVLSAKTDNGSWELGPYVGNNLHLSYVTDADYNAGTNRATAQFVFSPGGRISSNGKSSHLDLGTNPIASTAADTTANWLALGNGTAWFTEWCLSGQPTQYGFVQNVVGGSSVWQVWHSQPSGLVLVRSGNYAGWSTGWVSVSGGSEVLWTGTLSKDGSIAVPNASRYNLFIVGFNQYSITGIGTRANGAIMVTGSYDNGSKTNMYTAYMPFDGSTLRLEQCSWHTLYSGHGAHSINYLIGVI